jgi:hypothetical protein
VSPPTLTLGEIAASDDERIANVAKAMAHERGEAGSTARWALREWAGARAALVALREAIYSDAFTTAEVLEVIAEGLTLDERDV